MSKPVPLEPGQYYHIYNRGNNRERIFVERRNYHHFLRLYTHHIGPVADTFAYCLLPNHFHILIRIKAREPTRNPSQAFSNHFNAYAKAFNKAYERTGSLFEKPFGRIHVTADEYLAHLVKYVHCNPQKHGLVDDFRSWEFSSYRAHLSEQPTRLQRAEVLGWFQGQGGFLMAHRIETGDPLPAPLLGDDFD